MIQMLLMYTDKSCVNPSNPCYQCPIRILSNIAGTCINYLHLQFKNTNKHDHTKAYNQPFK
jgi:hypothetical protein